MHSKANNEQELVRSCMAELCRAAGFPDVAHLSQRDLMALCDVVESKTGTLISLSTIKRLLNGQFSRLPQIATLDAIAVSAGYQHWRDFASLKGLREKENGTAVGEEMEDGGTGRGSGSRGSVIEDGAVRNGAVKGWIAGGRGRRSIRAGYIVLGVVLVVVSWGALTIIMSNKPGPGNIDKAHFSARKVTGNDIPNTVVFGYNVDSVQADSFFIQQSWDWRRRVRVYKHQYTLTDIYYEPGYHNAKLIANDKIICTVPVSIPTDRWLFYAMENRPDSKPKYITPENPDSSMLKLSMDDLLKSKVDIQKENKFCELFFPSRIEYTSDSFTLKYRVRVKAVNNETCPLMMCEVFCQNTFMYFTSTLKGCTSELIAQFGEKELSGRYNDLSTLGSNLTDWQDMEFTVRNKKVSILINGKSVLSSGYAQSAGLITGVGFISNGLCEVQFVDLKTTDGRSIYTSYRH